MATLPALRRFAYSLTHSVPDADDLVQNTVERVLTRDIPADVEIAKWAFRICRNLWIDEYRAQKVREAAVHNPEFHQRQTFEGEKQVMQEMNLSSVGSAMQQLPTEHLTVLSMVAVQGCSYKEVAEALDIPLGTVMSRLARARTGLHKIIHAQDIMDSGLSSREVH
ncbi:RNA polymerase subunit sigma-70 [Aliidiomarina minuta]|uniref:RNA polymerase subunit sigma-70 n=1 Tax=Aliidiomarina minuta TaxID=880057 RepID=A0A432W4U8_9GAMM|nr:RNA polymerase sigma factor [Aliidiomarina minuta]RUO24532.1 RNA polymerase subunit sigma-70 [Aliidiomarina minuta]